MHLEVRSTESQVFERAGFVFFLFFFNGFYFIYLCFILGLNDLCKILEKKLKTFFYLRKNSFYRESWRFCRDVQKIVNGSDFFPIVCNFDTKIRLTC